MKGGGACTYVNVFSLQELLYNETLCSEKREYILAKSQTILSVGSISIFTLSDNYFLID